MHDRDNLQCWDCGDPTEFDSLDELEQMEPKFPSQKALYYCPNCIDPDGLRETINKWTKGHYYGLVYIESAGTPIDEVIDEMFEE